MKNGRVNARIDGYIYLEIAGKIQIKKYRELEDGTYLILSFQSIDANFEFLDETQKGNDAGKSALIISSKVIKTSSGFRTECVLEIY